MVLEKLFTWLHDGKTRMSRDTRILTNGIAMWKTP